MARRAVRLLSTYSIGLLATLAIIGFPKGSLADVQPVRRAENPYWPMANRSVSRTLALSEDQLMAEDKLVENAFWLAWGLAASQSQYTNSDIVRAKCVRVWDVVAKRLAAPHVDKLGAWIQLPLLETLLVLKNEGGIDEEKKSQWSAALHPLIEKTYVEYGLNGVERFAARSYPNADAQHAAVMYAGYLVYHEDKYKKNAAEFVLAMEVFLRPPGAWLYHRGSVPVPLYHSFELIFLGRYYQFSRDPLAASLIRRTKDYYPYVFTPQDTVEYSSSTWWKQVWSAQVGALHAPEIAAWLCGDGRNRWFADQRATVYMDELSNVYCAEAWDEGTATRPAPEAFPDRFIIEDQSISGLRGRFGLFSFVGSRGKSVMSFGGCLLDGAHGYNGYLQVARLGIGAPGNEGKPYYDALRLVGCPIGDEVHGGQVIADDFAALAAEYRPRLQVEPDVPNEKWKVLERWLFTERGVVATFEATALCDSSGSYPEGLIRLGPLQQPHGLEGAIFHVGSLQGRLLALDGFQPTMGIGAPDQNGHDRRIEMRLKPDPSPAHVQKGQKWRYAVLFAPNQPPDASVDFEKDDSLFISLNGRKYHLSLGEAGKLRVEIPTR